METLWHWLDAAIGLDGDALTWWQTAIRAAVAMILLVAFLRAGRKRLVAKPAALDLVVSIMIGSTMARSITSEGSPLPIYAAVVVLIGGHALLTGLAARHESFGTLIKGSRVRLAREGKLLEDNMVGSAITVEELRATLRDAGHEPDLESIEDAWLERDGSISIHRRSSGPKVVEVDVRDGVQRVRVEIE